MFKKLSVIILSTVSLMCLGQSAIQSKPFFDARVASTSLASDEIIVDLLRLKIADLNAVSKKVVMKELVAKLRLSKAARDPRMSFVYDFAMKNRVSTLSATSMENLLSFNPDRVVMANFNHPGFLSKVQSLGKALLVLERFKGFKDIHRNILEVSRFVGLQKQGEVIGGDFLSRLKSLKDVFRRDPSFLVFIGGVTLPGRDTLPNEIIEHLGGRNLAANTHVNGFKQFSKEWLIQQKPKFIILPVASSGTVLSDHDRQSALGPLLSIKPFRAMVEQGAKPIFVNKRGFWSTSHYLIDGLLDLAKQVCLHIECRPAEGVSPKAGKSK